MCSTQAWVKIGLLTFEVYKKNTEKTSEHLGHRQIMSSLNDSRND
jgi:hypothetical protein